MESAHIFVWPDGPSTRDSFRSGAFSLLACIKTAVFTSDKVQCVKFGGRAGMECLASHEASPLSHSALSRAYQ